MRAEITGEGFAAMKSGNVNWKPGNDHIEMRVRITTSQDHVLDGSLFPLASHQYKAPVDLLAGFLNKRQGEYFFFRMGEGQELMLSLGHCMIVELLRDLAAQMRTQNPAMAPHAMTTDPTSVVAYSPVLATLESGKVLRGDVWFYDFELPEERHVAAAFNRPERFVCLHGERSIAFIRRDAIVKVQMQPELEGEKYPWRPAHLAHRVGLMGGSVSPTALESASRLDSIETPRPVNPHPSDDVHRVSSGEHKQFPFAPRHGHAGPADPARHETPRVESGGDEDVPWY